MLKLRPTNDRDSLEVRICHELGFVVVITDSTEGQRARFMGI
jgi:hypothetical protein